MLLTFNRRPGMSRTGSRNQHHRTDRTVCKSTIIRNNDESRILGPDTVTGLDWRSSHDHDGVVSQTQEPDRGKICSTRPCAFQAGDMQWTHRVPVGILLGNPIRGSDSSMGYCTRLLGCGPRMRDPGGTEPCGKRWGWMIGL